MVMQTVYDAEGNAIEVEPVDAREYIASGTYFAAPKKTRKHAEPPADAAPATQPGGLDDAPPLKHRSRKVEG